MAFYKFFNGSCLLKENKKSHLMGEESIWLHSIYYCVEIAVTDKTNKKELQDSNNMCVLLNLKDLNNK